MTYSELLTSYIDQSGLSLGEIAVKLSSKGISIDRSYISKLKNGNKPPASEDITRALAEVTGGDPDKLIIAAQIERLKPVLEEVGDEGFNDFLNTIAKLHMERTSLDKFNESLRLEAQVQGLPFTPLSQEEWENALNYEDKIDLSRFFAYRIEAKDGRTIKVSKSYKSSEVLDDGDSSANNSGNEHEEEVAYVVEKAGEAESPERKNFTNKFMNEFNKLSIETQQSLYELIKTMPKSQ